MTKAGEKGHFTNHSLRATAVSRLFHEGVDDKLIKGVTGHRSEALETYKRQTDEQLVKVSKILQGQASEDKRKEENWKDLPIPNDMGAITLNISGGNCNVTINNN